MKLTVLERLKISSLLPEKGSFVNLKLIRKAKEDLSFSDEEIKKYKITVTDDGRVSWLNKDNKEKDIDFGYEVKEIIKKALKELDEKQELEDHHMSIYEKFMN